jgi:hypothetical protein
MPTKLIENCARYLEATDLLSLRLDCRKTEAQTVRVVGHRLFSTLKTNLMGCDFVRLDELSRSKKFARHVKSIYISDDSEKMETLLSIPNTPNPSERMQRKKALSHIWARNDSRAISATEIGVAALRTMFRDKRLRAESITIRGHVPNSETLTIQPIATLARDILADANLAVTSLRMNNRRASATEATFQFDTKYQGKHANFSRLREAD